MTNHHVIFTKRPGANGLPCCDNFKFDVCPEPENPTENQVKIKTLYIAMDPALRCRMNEDTGVDYIGPWQIGHTVEGFGGIGVILQSANTQFKEGDVVCSQSCWPWIEFFTWVPSEAFQLNKIDPALVNGHITLYLSGLGLTSGITAYLGVKEKGHICQGANQTMVISGAAGACGSLAGQIAKLLGCGKLIGICGTAEKCKRLTSDLGFDSAVNYKTQDVEQELKTLCPDGIDVYFDNVGGELSNTVILQMNKSSHVILCGQIAVYNKDLPYPPPIPNNVENFINERNITRDRYLVLNYQDKFEDSSKQLAQWVVQGKLKIQETTEEGLENAGKAFVSMMTGGNIGKQLVHIADN